MRNVENTRLRLVFITLSLMFSNACRVLSLCATQLRLLHLLSIHLCITNQKSSDVQSYCDYCFTVMFKFILHSSFLHLITVFKEIQCHNEHDLGHIYHIVLTMPGRITSMTRNSGLPSGGSFII